MNGRVSSWAVVAGGTALAVSAWAALWWLATPRHQICGLTNPAPAGCDADRVPVAVVWSVAVAGFYAAVLFAAARRAAVRSGTLPLIGVAVTGLCGFVSVLYT